MNTESQTPPTEVPGKNVDRDQVDHDCAARCIPRGRQTDGESKLVVLECSVCEAPLHEVVGPIALTKPDSEDPLVEDYLARRVRQINRMRTEGRYVIVDGAEHPVAALLAKGVRAIVDRAASRRVWPLED